MTCPFRVGERVRYLGTRELGRDASLSPPFKPGDRGVVTEVVSDGTLKVRFDHCRGALSRMYLTGADGLQYDILEREVVANPPADPTTSETNGGPQTGQEKVGQ